jgi:fructose-specific phosphotransferase system component IIB
VFKHVQNYLKSTLNTSTWNIFMRPIHMYEKINLHPRFNQTLQERKATIIMNDTSINLVKFTGQHIMQMKNKKYITNETRCVRNIISQQMSFPKKTLDIQTTSTSHLHLHQNKQIHVKLLNNSSQMKINLCWHEYRNECQLWPVSSKVKHM